MKAYAKAKVEAGVLVVERWLLATLRNRTFFSLVELNAAIREKLEWLNNRLFKKMDGSRRSLFEDIDRPAAPAAGKPLRVRDLEEGQGQYQMVRAQLCGVERRSRCALPSGLHIIPPPPNRLELAEDVWLQVPDGCGGLRAGLSLGVGLDGLSFHLQVDARIAPRGLGAGMTEDVADGARVGAGLEHEYGGCVPKHVGVDALLRDGRAGVRC